MHMRTHLHEHPTGDQTPPHIPRKHEGLKFKCQLCDKSYTYTQRLKEHIQNKHPTSDQILIWPQPNEYTCKTCNLSLTGVENFIKHILTHEIQKDSVCQLCHKSISKPSEFIRHMTSHSIEKTQICQICNKKYKLEAHLRAHMKTHMLSR